MLSKQRQEIDRIDQALVSLFEERMNLVLEVARIKKANGLPVLDAAREELVYQKVTSYLENPDLTESVKALYAKIMSLSKSYQSDWLAEQERNERI